MRRGKRHTCVAILLLMFGVGAREAPEILNLIEDWSNDAMVVSSEIPVAPLVQRSTSLQKRVRGTPTACFDSMRLKKRNSLPPVSVSNQETGKGRLHFLSIQRV